MLTDCTVKMESTLSEDLLLKLLEIHCRVSYLPDKTRVWVKINNKFYEGKNEKIFDFLAKDA